MDELTAALAALEAKWEMRVGETQQAIRKLRIGDPNHSYYRGIAEGYKAALKDLRALMHEPDETQPAEAAETYVAVDRGRALKVLDRAGLSITDLHVHKDNTFTAVFAPLQVLSMDERITRLMSAADVAILDTGRLPNTNKAYIDFAFRSAPE